MAKREPGPIKKKTTINHRMKIRKCGKKGEIINHASWEFYFFVSYQLTPIFVPFVVGTNY